MPLAAPDATLIAPGMCPACGTPLFATIVGPRCPIHGVEGARGTVALGSLR